MDERNGMNRNRVIRRLMLHTLQHLVAIGIAVMVGFIAVNSNIVVDNMYGDQIGYRVGMMDNAGEFEDSRIFTNVFRNAINDITRLAVIKGQLETNGIFDGSRIVDVTTFVNRISQKSTCPVSANYHLDELIRWGKYGLELQTVTFQSKFDFIVYFGYESVFNSYSYGEQLEKFGFTEEDISNLFTWDMKNKADRPENELDEDAGSEDFPLDFDFMEQSEAYETAKQYIDYIWGIDALFNRITVEMATQGKEVLILDRGGQEIISTEMLVPRYNTITEQSIAASCSNWLEYCMLEANVVETVETLAYNYTLYQNQNDLYAQGKTNLHFFISTTTSEGQEYYTNMDADFIDMTDSERTGYFRGLGKYVIYFPDTMYLDSNAGITEDEMFDNVSDYEYAFPENTKLWIGVDTDFPIQRDQFYLAMDTYNSIIPHMWLILLFSGIFLLIWMGIGGYISYTTGKTKEGEKIVSRPYVFDRLPTEIFLLLMLAAGLGLWVLFRFIYGNIYDTVFYRTSRATMQQLTAAKQYVLAMIGGLGLLTSLSAGLFWYSLVRRLQCSMLWKNSIFYRICRVIYRGLKMMLENHNAVIRTLMPYNIFLLANLLCVLAIYGLRDAAQGLQLIPLLVIVILDGGVGIYIFRRSAERSEIIGGISRIRGGDIGYMLDSEHLHGDNKELAVSVNNMGDGIRKAVATSMKDERMQADLITNVSHDIKTPLTSIINYVDLLKREKITQEPACSYITVLDSKAQRLKQLTDDLLEASKISSGNITLDNSRLDLTELVRQSVGEFSEKLEARRLQVMITEPSGPAYIFADSRRMWRVVENLFNNICKYAMEGTRVYVDLEKEEGIITLSMKNISETALNFNPDELTERFVRGDVSRSSEGSGLGLSIAKNLTELQKGEFRIVLDGDLFKTLLRFQEYRETEESVAEASEDGGQN